MFLKKELIALPGKDLLRVKMQHILMDHDIIEQELRALEAIVANPKLPSREKIGAMRKFERVLSRHSGITLRALQEAGHVINFKGLSKKQRLDELRAIENVFVEGAMLTAKSMGKAIPREQIRKIFSAYVKQHFKIKIGSRLRKARLARKKQNLGARIRPVQRPRPK